MTTNINPSDEAGCFSVVFLTWMNSLLSIGNKRPLNGNDLFPLTKNHKTEVIVERFDQMWKDEILRSEIEGRRPRLWRVMIRFVPMYDCVVMSLLKIGESLSSYSTSVFLWYYLKLQMDNDINVSVWQSIGAMIGIGVSCIARVLILHHHRLQSFLMGMQLKVACIGMIYKKVLSSNRSNVSEVGVGKIMNFISNDAMRMEEIVKTFQFCTIAYIDNVIALALLWIIIGWQSLSGIIVILFFFSFQILLSREFAKYRKKQTVATDRRLSAMNDIVKGIRMIKMCGWEDNYSSLVRTLRRIELKLVRVKSIIISFSQGLYFTLRMVATLVSVFSMLYTGIPLTSASLFTLTAILGTATDSVTEQVYSVRSLYDSLVSINRIEKYLLSDLETSETFQKENSSLMHNFVSKYFALFNNEGKKYGYSNPTADITNAQTETLTEIQTKFNSFTLQGNTQDPHIRISQMSCRWNDKMCKVLHDVSLELKSSRLLFVTGPVGSGKTSLLMAILREIIIQEGKVSTQGQMAYVGQIPWIFTGTVRENILFGRPYDKERYQMVLESCDLLQDIQHFPKGDMSMLGQRGILLSGGQRTRVALARAVYSDSEIFLLDDPFSAVDGKVGQHVFDKCICGQLSGKIRILVTHQLQYLHRADEIFVFKDGSVVDHGSFSEICQSEKAGKIILSPDLNYTQSSLNDSGIKTEAIIVNTSHEERRGADLIEAEEYKASGTVSSRLYWEYMKAGSSTLAVVALILLFLVIQGFIIAPKWWLKILSHMPYEKQRSAASIGIFSGLVVSAWLLATIRMALLFILLLMASEKLHDVITQAVIKSPVLFFDTNPVGRIMNRFSKDIGIMDDVLPYKFNLLFSVIFQLIGVLAVTGAVNYWFAIVILPTVVLYTYLCRFYLKTARELSRMEAVRCSPVYEHISETIEGLEAIHSFHMQQPSLEKLYSLQNLHTKAFSLVLNTNRWVGLYVDFLGALFATVIGIGTLVFSMDPASSGLVLSYIIGMLRMCSISILQASKAETKMISVERVKEYTKLPPEPGYNRKVEPPNNWPSKGAVSFRGVFMSYQEAGPYVLKNVTFEVKPEEKVGIVGRTGAGKSSLVAALFRMADPIGQIFIDGVDLGCISIQSARSSMAVIAQDPTLIAGTLRVNLDPFDCFTEDEIWTALNEVQMLKRTQRLKDSLEHHLGEEGSGFSVGEKQLLCLARALLQRKRILVLDEATANVDLKTDQLIQKVIREKFVHCTVLTIAHRLKTIMDYDRVLVLDQGHVVQYDTPEVLAKETEGVFAKLLQSHGLDGQE